MLNLLLDTIILLGLVFLWHELDVLFRLDWHLSMVHRITAITDTKALSKNDKAYVNKTLLYGVWLAALMFTDQWLPALLITLIGLVPKRMPAWLRFDAICSIIAIVYIITNHFIQ